MVIIRIDPSQDWHTKATYKIGFNQNTQLDETKKENDLLVQEVTLIVKIISFLERRRNSGHGATTRCATTTFGCGYPQALCDVIASAIHKEEKHNKTE